MYKKDCFAFTERRGCQVLKETECEDCAFYKSREQYDADEIKIRKSIRQKPQLEIDAINGRYGTRY